MNEEQIALLEDFFEADHEKMIRSFGLFVTAGLVAEVKRDEEHKNVQDFTLIPEAEEYLRTRREGQGQEIRR